MGQVSWMFSAAGELVLRLACVPPPSWFSAPRKGSSTCPPPHQGGPENLFLNINSVFFANVQKSCKCGKIPFMYSASRLARYLHLTTCFIVLSMYISVFPIFWNHLRVSWKPCGSLRLNTLVPFWPWERGHCLP